jgi:hypothetical protein
MLLSKKFLITGIICVTALAATIGGVAMANATDNATSDSSNTSPMVQMMDKVAEIYQQNTGTALDVQALENAFNQAQTALAADRIDTILQKLVTDGKITQEQADQWKAWWESRPSSAVSDEFKTWMESRPDIPGMMGGGNFGKGMPFGRGGCFGAGDDTTGNANGNSNGGFGMMRGNRFNTTQR